MRVKKEYIILVCIILALSLYLILRNPNRTHYQLPEIPKLVGADVSKIEISKSDSSMVLHKKGDTWYIEPEGYPADSDRVKNMLDVIEKLTVTAMVSKSENYNRYNLGDKNKITVKAWKGDKLMQAFGIGKAASSYRHTFIKLADDERVYHARGNFRSKFDQTVDNLRDKTVLSFDKTEIQEIQITDGQKTMTLARAEVPVEVSTSQEPDAKNPPSKKVETVWQTTEGKKADETKLNRLLTTLSRLKCEKYIDDRKKEDFTNPTFTLQLKGQQEYTLSVFAKSDKEAKNFPAVSSENDYPFLLPKWQADNLMKKPDDLLKKPEKG